MPWIVHGILTRVVDGDTVVADLDLGWKIWLRSVSIRLAGIDAPEMNTQAGKDAKLSLLGYEGAPIIVTSHKLDKYGRVLANVEIDGKDLSQLQLSTGRAVVYP